MEKKVIKSIILAGIAGGIIMNLTIYLLFAVIGFGLNYEGILLNPNIQSEKLIAVWTEIEPLPLAISNPLVFIIGILCFGIIHAIIYHWLSISWPIGIKNRSVRLAILIFLLSYLFFEFFTPFNMFGEPLLLIGLELIFWLIIALSEAFTISLIFEWHESTK